MQKKLAVFAASIAWVVFSASSLAEPVVQANESGSITAVAQDQAARGKFKEAEKNYRKALTINPLDTRAISGLIALYRQQGMYAKEQLTIAQLTVDQRSALGASLKRIESIMLQDQADLRLAKGQDDQAIKYLEQAVKVEVDDPWLHFKLAQQYARRGSITMGLTLLEDFSARNPNIPDGLYALALYQSERGDTGNALKILNRIEAAQRSRDMLQLHQRLSIKNLAQDTKLLMQSGKKSDAIKMVSEAEAISSGNEELTLAVALAWAELGDIKRGRSLFEKVKTERAPPSVNWHLRFAEFLAKIESEQELSEELKTISEMPNLSPAEKVAVDELREFAAVRQADKHTLAGDAALAHQTLAPLLKQNPGQVRLLLADARAYRAERKWQPAIDIYTRILKSDYISREARSGMVSVLTESGDRAKALLQLDEWAADKTANEVYVGVYLSGMYSDAGEYGRAKRVIDQLIADHPDVTYILYDAWKMAQREGRVDHEIDYLKKLVVAEPYIPPGSPQKDDQKKPPLADENIGIDEFGSEDRINRDWKGKKLAGLIDRRSDWLSAAIDVRSRSGTAGVSQFNSIEVPLEYKTPWHTDDEVFFRTDLIKLNSGSVVATEDRFGGMQLCQPTCTSALLRQATQGMSFTAGYQRGDFSADIGFTPRNFPVSNTVGSIMQKGDLGAFGYSIEAERRPVTSSFLSFAGTKDPYTGRVWGGVVATGGNLGLSLDKGGDFGFWSSFGLHNLTGRNVLSNKRVQIMAGEQWRVINEENRRFVIGLTGMYWNFDKNVGEYTFGHGGYYSPHKYRSLALPITYTARSPRFSYMLRGSVSKSRSTMTDAPFYPTDSALQAQAELTPKSNYTGGPSTGKGHSLTAAWEYQFNPQLFAGGMLSIVRSDYYAPNRALLYLRYSLDRPGAKPVFMPPEPMEPSSQL